MTRRAEDQPRRRDRGLIEVLRTLPRTFPCCIRLILSAQLGDQSVVLSVRANPEPNNVLPITKRKGPVPQTDANREDRACGMYLFELKAGMERVPLEEAVCASGVAPNMLRKLLKRRTEALVRVGIHIFSGSSGFVRPAR